jgi:hypothetical protein
VLVVVSVNETVSGITPDDLSDVKPATGAAAETPCAIKSIAIATTISAYLIFASPVFYTVGQTEHTHMDNHTEGSE